VDAGHKEMRVRQASAIERDRLLAEQAQHGRLWRLRRLLPADIPALGGKTLDGRALPRDDCNNQPLSGISPIVIPGDVFFSRSPHWVKSREQQPVEVGQQEGNPGHPRQLHSTCGPWNAIDFSDGTRRAYYAWPRD
jgi:hypothetical protein